MLRPLSAIRSAFWFVYSHFRQLRFLPRFCVLKEGTDHRFKVACITSHPYLNVASYWDQTCLNTFWLATRYWSVVNELGANIHALIRCRRTQRKYLECVYSWLTAIPFSAAFHSSPSSPSSHPLRQAQRVCGYLHGVKLRYTRLLNVDSVCFELPVDLS